MTPSLKQLIREEAEQFSDNQPIYEFPANNAAYWRGYKHGYIAGAEWIAEKMEGFNKWANSDYHYEYFRNVWYSRNRLTFYTTSELLTKYFDHLKEKEDSNG